MQVLQVFQAAQEAFPDAVVRASTFEEFVDRLAPFASLKGTYPPPSAASKRAACSRAVVKVVATLARRHYTKCTVPACYGQACWACCHMQLLRHRFLCCISESQRPCKQQNLRPCIFCAQQQL